MPNVTFVKAPVLDISATFIRQCVKQEKSYSTWCRMR